MKNRYLLCLLLSICMLYYAIPRFSLQAGGLEKYFFLAWLLLAFFVVAGNLSALLYTPSKKETPHPKALDRKKRTRSY